MSTVELVADKRTEMGRKVKALRRAGFIPANVVAKGKDSRQLKIAELPLKKILSEVGFTQPVELVVDGDKITVLVTDVTRVPAKNTLEHVTFQEVKKGELVTVDVPLTLVGDAPGVTAGLILLQLVDTVSIETGALRIPEHLDVDVTGLTEDGDLVRANQLDIPEGAELKSDPEAAIARLEAPKIIEEEPEEVVAVEGEEADGEAKDGEAEKEA